MALTMTQPSSLERQMDAMWNESERLSLALRDALAQRNRAAAHGAVDRMFDLAASYDAIQAESQQLAGEGSQLWEAA